MRVFLQVLLNLITKGSEMIAMRVCSVWLRAVRPRKKLVISKYFRLNDGMEIWVAKLRVRRAKMRPSDRVIPPPMMSH